MSYGFTQQDDQSASSFCLSFSISPPPSLLLTPALSLSGRTASPNRRRAHRSCVSLGRLSFMAAPPGSNACAGYRGACLSISSHLPRTHARTHARTHTRNVCGFCDFDLSWPRTKHAGPRPKPGGRGWVEAAAAMTMKRMPFSSPFLPSSEHNRIGQRYWGEMCMCVLVWALACLSRHGHASR